MTRNDGAYEGAQHVAEVYSRPEQVADMDERLGLGLQEWEKRVVAAYFPCGARVLDVGCGSGREGIALAQRGFEVTGVDFSAAQLERARTRAAEAGVAVIWQLTDGLSLPAGPFEAATVWAQVLGNIDRHEDQIALLRSCRNVLQPGGVISVSGHYGPYCRRVWGGQTEGDWFYPTGRWGQRELRYWLYDEQSLEAVVDAAELEVVATEVPDSLPAIIHIVARRAPARRYRVEAG